jgi:hypothetical protein
VTVSLHQSAYGRLSNSTTVSPISGRIAAQLDKQCWRARSFGMRHEETAADAPSKAWTRVTASAMSARMSALQPRALRSMIRQLSHPCTRLRTAGKETILPRAVCALCCVMPRWIGGCPLKCPRGLNVRRYANRGYANGRAVKCNGVPRRSRSASSQVEHGRRRDNCSAHPALAIAANHDECRHPDPASVRSVRYALPRIRKFTSIPSPWSRDSRRSW